VTADVRGALDGHPEVGRALWPLRKAAKGAPIHLVGGTVRDLLLGAGTVDLDIVVVGDALPVARRLASATDGRVTVHRAFGTALVRGPLTADLTTARRETYPHPGSLPLVEWTGSLDQDLGRRDFSINAMAVALAEDAYGELEDPFGGRGDLGSRALRILHDRSFLDDPTRLLRGARYAARLGFAFEPATHAAALAAAGGVGSVGPDRLRDALELVLREEAAAGALAVLHELGVLQAIGARFEPDVLARHDAFRAAHAPDAEAWVGRFALIDAPAEICPARVRRVAAVAARAGARITAAGDDPAALAGGLRRAPVEAVVCAAAREPDLAPAAARYLDVLRAVRLEVDGDDLIGELGASPGPALGAVLDELLARRLRGELTTRNEQLQAARRLLAPPPA
jgi:tRNA nucleotidyltransferase (CCA-adding enzyme)